jgi:hypothetical protein
VLQALREKPGTRRQALRPRRREPNRDDGGRDKRRLNDPPAGLAEMTSINLCNTWFISITMVDRGNIEALIDTIFPWSMRLFETK